MNIRFPKTLIAAALFAAAPLALAQTTPATQPKQDSNMQMQKPVRKMPARNMHQKMDHSKMMGSHNMPATVTSVDHKTGIVELESAGKDLTVHFPPSTITNLKDGDKIKLHLSYKMSGSDSMMKHSM